MISTEQMLSGRQQVMVSFCPCRSDCARLVEMGYIGGTPVRPQTAFSIRLLRTHSIVWKHCTVATQGWSAAVDEILDAFWPLLLMKGTGKVQI